MKVPVSHKAPRVLFISAADSCGAAGHDQDLRAAALCGCWPLSAISGVTVQNFERAVSAYPASDSYLQEAIESAIATGCGSVKVGALFTLRSLEIIASFIDRLPPIVWDPVFAPTAGSPFYGDAMIDFFRREILPATWLCTPNKDEIEIMAQKSFATQYEAAQWACTFRSRPFFLIKGGHFNGHASTIHDYLVTDRIEILSRQRRNFPFFRGSGCLLSSLIACRLAKGDELPIAVRSALDIFESYYISCNTDTQDRSCST